MQAYTGFAYVYDEYMDNIPYEEWCEYLVERLKEQGVTPDMEIADLGCGTGTVTQLLDKAVLGDIRRRNAHAAKSREHQHGQ